LHALLQRMTLEPYFDIMRLIREDYKELNLEQQHKLTEMWYSDVFYVVQNLFEEGMKRGELKPHDTALGAYTFMNLFELLPNPDNPMASYLRFEGNSQAEYIEKLLEMFLGGLSR
jgi:hypothetical protein